MATPQWAQGTPASRSPEIIMRGILSGMLRADQLPVKKSASIQRE